MRSSTRTSFPLLSHHLLSSFVHGRHTGSSHPSTKSKGSTKASLNSYPSPTWCRRTSVRPPDDTEKSVTHRLHWAMPLSGNFAIQATSLLQSSLNSLSCIFFSAPFFQRGLRHLISRERRIAKIIWKTARANYPKNAGDYPIAIHHPWHVTSSVDAAGGQQWLMTAARREI